MVDVDGMQLNDDELTLMTAHLVDSRRGLTIVDELHWWQKCSDGVLSEFLYLPLLLCPSVRTGRDTG